MFLTLHKITITAVPETLKLLKENTDKILQDIKAQDFPRRSQISQETISETHKLDSKKKKILQNEETMYKVGYTSDRKFICRVNREPK